VQKSCICYVVDDNYLFPTLLSGSQAKSHLNRSDVDIVIICLSKGTERLDIARPVAEALGLKIVHATPETIDNLHPMYGRLFIPKLLSGYERIVYVDGDTQIADSLSPLVDVIIPTGKFLAVRDPASMFARLSDKWEQRVKADREAAGLDGPYDDYLNTGVLVFNATDWKDLSRLTLDKIQERDDSFKFGDQDPMNLAIGDRCLYISNRWNFPGFLVGTEAEARVRPVIYHFMSNPRPWLHSGLPWGSKWSTPYAEFLQRFPELRPLAPTTTSIHKLRYHVQQAMKVISEYAPVSRFTEATADLVV
jgi:lipopolysaccharide biosynthesis glycosyltransferase